LNYVEYYSALKKKWYHFGSRLNDKLFDKYAPSLTDAVFPISEFLVSHVKRISPRKKFLKIPVLTDFDKYQSAEFLRDQKYFLFCGDATYKEIVLFIIESFELIAGNTSFFLYLVIGGNENDITDIKSYISNCKQSSKIKLFSRLTEKDLYTFYRNASALLIPLRPTFQDTARFPHKTGEYLASGNPVISTNYGEIKFYFQDKENMLLADQYDPKLFAEKMQFVIDKPDQAKKIGLKGKEIASRLFDYRSWSRPLNSFLSTEL
jgi:glycosyltransferase involved in cell wall biosynthesis